MTNSPDYRWFVFYCRSRTEKKTYSKLVDENYNAYLPLLTEYSQWSDRLKKVQVPMFKSYIFVNCPFHSIYKIASSDSNIINPVKIGKEYAVLKPKDIELLTIIETKGLEAASEPITVQQGDCVEVVRGSLKGYSGICIQEYNKKYVLIAIEAISHYVKVRIYNKFLKIKHKYNEAK